MNNNHSKTYVSTAIIAIALASMLVMAPMFGTAHAAKGTSGVHFQGQPATVTCNANGCSFNTFTLAGLGQGTGTASLQVSATWKTECTNPGGNVAPGQDKTGTFNSPVQSFSTDRGGKATVSGQSVSIAPPPDSTVVCPNNSWTGEVVGEPTVTGTLSVTFNGQPLAGFPITDTYP